MRLSSSAPSSMPEPVVLLAEDNDDARQVYATYLNHIGYRVREARTGVDAVNIAQSEQVDLILMDIGLPELDGWDATRQLKADARTRSIPVVALTAYAMPSDAATAAAVGCTAFLAKPCTPREVAFTIERVLAADETPSPS